jgi:hypothetical protein
MNFSNTEQSNQKMVRFDEFSTFVLSLLLELKSLLLHGKWWVRELEVIAGKLLLSISFSRANHLIMNTA